MTLRTLKPIQTTPLVGGVTCLDFVNTTGARSSGAPRERLIEYSNLIVFCRRTELLTAAQATPLARLAASDRTGAAMALRDAIAVRELLYHLLSAVAARRRPAGPDVAQFNARVANAMTRRRLEWHRGEPRWAWSHDVRKLDACLCPILHSAARLLESSDLARLRKCGECDWLFLDSSKNRSRRWCKKDCRDRVKARSYYRRKKAARRRKLRTTRGVLKR